MKFSGQAPVICHLGPLHLSWTEEVSWGRGHPWKSHKFVSFHNVRSLGETSPVSQQSHIGYTPRGSWHDSSEQWAVSRASIWGGPTCSRWRGGLSLQPGGCSGGTCLVRWTSSRALSVACGAAGLEPWATELWVLTAHKRRGSHSHRRPDGVLIRVSRLVVWDIPCSIH